MTELRALGASGLLVSPFCLGGNVFGWTADKAQSFAVLNAYVAAGGNFIDTADAYMNYFPEQGNEPGQSETIIGDWRAWPSPIAKAWPASWRSSRSTTLSRATPTRVRGGKS
ncbi:aldo/keto reductase [Nonomuraea sp. NPDC052116]|uniref:aldo/keto reductase n=1 Tax=Nonomuraea sp. NPDC052116 TaxID=3155665 RepID=UPI003416FBF8